MECRRASVSSKGYFPAHTTVILRSRALARRLEGWPRAPASVAILRGSPPTGGEAPRSRGRGGGGGGRARRARLCPPCAFWDGYVFCEGSFWKFPPTQLGYGIASPGTIGQNRIG